MSRKFVDISISLNNEIVSDPPFGRPQITYFDHGATLGRLHAFFPGLSLDNLPDKAVWATENVSLTTHSGTHLDAPYHYHPTMNHALEEGGEPAITIDEVPLEWCFQQGVKLDFRHLPDGYVATAADITRELDRIGHTLRPLDIVLVNTRAGECYGQDGYLTAGCGVGREATLFLLERGVRVTGTDAWSWDAPFRYTKERVDACGDYSLIWEGHKAGRERAYCHLEKLNNLECLPDKNFMVCCFPVKLHRASSGWTRAVAIVDEPTQ